MIRSKFYLPVICGTVPRLPYTLKKGNSKAKNTAATFFLTLFKPHGLIHGKDGLSWSNFKSYVRECAAPTAKYNQRAILQTILNMLNGMRVSTRKKRLLNKWRVRGVTPWVLLDNDERLRIAERKVARGDGINVPAEIDV